MDNSSTCTNASAVAVAVPFILFSLIFVVGVTGNTLILYAIFSRKQMKTPSNYFIISLTIADLGCLLLALPYFTFSSYAIFNQDEAFCRLYMIILKTFIYSSTYTHVAIAFERRSIIVFPMKPKLSPKKLKIASASIWLLVLVCIAPIYGFLFNRFPDCGASQCDLSPKTNFSKILFYFAVLFFNWLVPFGSLVWSYSQICSCLREHNAPTQDPNVSRRYKQNRKIIRMFIVLVLAFACANVPAFVNIILSIIRMSPSIHLSIDMDHYGLISHIIFFAGSACNPFVLYFMSQEYRKAFNHIFTSCLIMMCFKSTSFPIQQKQETY